MMKSLGSGPTGLLRAMLLAAVASLLQACAVAASPAGAPQTAVPAPAKPAITVTLLGTGTPEPDIDRFGPATLVEAAGMQFLFDAGRGVPIRLGQAKVAVGLVDTVFITHLHSDHVAGLPDLWLTGMLPVVGNRTRPLGVVGPPGTGALVDNMAKAFGEDIAIRIGELRLTPAQHGISSREFSGEGVVFDSAGVKVTAFPVKHGAVMKHAFGYRLDYAGHSVLISGDTSYEANVIKWGTGVDLLVHEVAQAPEWMKDRPVIKAILALHTTPEECGRIFSLARPKMAAYTHLALLRGPGFPPVEPRQLLAQTRSTYDGPLVVGEDLTRFEIGEQVRVLRWSSQLRDFIEDR